MRVGWCLIFFFNQSKALTDGYNAIPSKGSKPPAVNWGEWGWFNTTMAVSNYNAVNVDAIRMLTVDKVIAIDIYLKLLKFEENESKGVN